MFLICVFPSQGQPSTWELSPHRLESSFNPTVRRGKHDWSNIWFFLCCALLALTARKHSGFQLKVKEKGLALNCPFNQLCYSNLHMIYRISWCCSQKQETGYEKLLWIRRIFKCWGGMYTSQNGTQHRIYPSLSIRILIFGRNGFKYAMSDTANNRCLCHLVDTLIL